MRHYINLTILYSILNTFQTVGPFDLNWDTQQYKCWISQYITFALLACLQSLNLFWLFFVVKIAVNVVFSDVVKDVRSDDEEEEEPADKTSGPRATNGSTISTVSEPVAAVRKTNSEHEMYGPGILKAE